MTRNSTEADSQTKDVSQHYQSKMSGFRRGAESAGRVHLLQKENLRNEEEQTIAV